MEHLGWDIIQPIVADLNASSRSSAWTSQPQQPAAEEISNSYDNNGSLMYATAMRANIIDHGFHLDNIDDMTNSNNEMDSRVGKQFATPADPGLIDSSAEPHQEKAVATFGSSLPTSNAFCSQLQQKWKSSGSAQMCNYILTTNTTSLINAYLVEENHFSPNDSANNTNNNNANLLGIEGDGISSNDNLIMPSSAVSSRKRKAAVAEDAQYDNGHPHAHIGKANIPTEIIKFNDNENPTKRRSGDKNELTTFYDHSSSGAEGVGGLSQLIIPAKKEQTQAACERLIPRSSNINFQLRAIISTEKDVADPEATAEMKEMVYRAAAFRPVNLGVDEVVEKPTRKNVKISSDPQTAAARLRRERISDRIRVLQRIVPGGNKMDTATMLDEAANYLKFLRSQVKALEKTASFGFSSYNFLPSS